MHKAVTAMFSLVMSVESPVMADVPIPALAVMNAKAELQEGRQVELDVRVRNSGELLLFDSPEAMSRRLVYPYCISAGLAGKLGETRAAAELDGKRVRVKGTLVRYENPPREPNTIATHTEVDGMYFKNWCLGPYVLKIEELKVAQ